jgi:hypothetical protein
MNRTLIEIKALSKQCYCTGDCKKSGAGVCIGAAMNLKKLTSYLWKIEHRSSFVFVSFSISFTLSGNIFIYKRHSYKIRFVNNMKGNSIFGILFKSVFSVFRY